MPTVDLTPYNQVQGSTSDGTKFDNLIAAIQATINAIDDANLSPSAAIAYTKLALTGKLVNTDLSASAAIAIAKLAGYPSDGTKALFGDGTWKVTGAASVGTELDYAQITTTTASIAATSEGTAVAVITGNSITYDGSKVRLEFWCPAILNGGSGDVATFVLLRDTTVLGRADADSGNAATVTGQRATSVVAFDTPAAGAHTYKIAAYVSAGSIQVAAGATGPGNRLPAFLRVTKA